MQEGGRSRNHVHRFNRNPRCAVLRPVAGFQQMHQAETRALDDPNYRGAADDLGRNCEPDVPNYRGADDLNYHDADDLDDLNYRDVADDLGQNCEPDDPDDRVALGDLDGHQHQLGVADDFPLQKVLPDGQFARHDLCEDDAQNRGFRRVAWHIDAIAKTTNKD